MTTRLRRFHRNTSRGIASLAAMKGLLAVLAALLALSLAACGGDDDSDDGSGGSATPATQDESTKQDQAKTTTSEQETATTVDGDWSGTYESSQGGAGAFEMKLTQSGAEFSGSIQVPGSCVESGSISGSVEGGKISFGAVKGNATISYDGTVKGDQMSGTYSAPAECASDSGSWEASR